MLEREDILIKAMEDCYREMFAKAQPAADWDNLIQEYRDGKIDEDKDGPVYDRHYLSQDEFVYILDKYLDAYRIKSEWREDIEILEEYLTKGGSKDKYFESYEDENGYHPAYRGYEHVAPLKNHIKDIIAPYYVGYEKTQDEIAQKVTDKVMGLISDCKNFYSFNRDEMKFRNTLAMGASPTSKAETVKKWWKDHYDVDIEIEERNPLLFWEYDYYGDEIDDVMSNEYGENWKEIFDKKWEEQKAQKKAELEELKKKFEALKSDVIVDKANKKDVEE